MSKDIKKAIEDTLKKEDLLFAEVNYYYTDTVEAIYNAIKPIIINKIFVKVNLEFVLMIRVSIQMH